MQELGTASEDDVILAFVQSEINSPKWGPFYKANLLGRGLDPANWLSSSNAAVRRGVLGDVRGFRRNDGLFRGFPLDVKWRRVSVEPSDFSRLKYISSAKDWEPRHAARARWCL